MRSDCVFARTARKSWAMRSARRRVFRKISVERFCSTSSAIRGKAPPTSVRSHPTRLARWNFDSDIDMPALRDLHDHRRGPRAASEEFGQSARIGFELVAENRISGQAARPEFKNTVPSTARGASRIFVIVNRMILSTISVFTQRTSSGSSRQSAGCRAIRPCNELRPRRFCMARRSCINVSPLRTAVPSSALRSAFARQLQNLAERRVQQFRSDIVAQQLSAATECTVFRFHLADRLRWPCAPALRIQARNAAKVSPDPVAAQISVSFFARMRRGQLDFLAVPWACRKLTSTNHSRTSGRLTHFSEARFARVRTVCGPRSRSGAIRPRNPCGWTSEG